MSYNNVEPKKKENCVGKGSESLDKEEELPSLSIESNDVNYFFFRKYFKTSFHLPFFSFIVFLCFYFFFAFSSFSSFFSIFSKQRHAKARSAVNTRTNLTKKMSMKTKKACPRPRKTLLTTY